METIFMGDGDISRSTLFFLMECYIFYFIV